jgi:hypothetical protein
MGQFSFAFMFSFRTFIAGNLDRHRRRRRLRSHHPPPHSLHPTRRQVSEP